MDHSTNPLVERRRLRLELRQARQDARLTQDEVARGMYWSLSKVIRIEAGSVSISVNDLKALLHLYGVTDRQIISALVERASIARQWTFWTRYHDALAPGFHEYIELAASASVIRSCDAFTVPRLLQTDEYATALGQLRRPNSTTAEIADTLYVEISRREQELLGQPDAALLFFVLDEAVIRRLTGDRDVRQAQLEKLISTASRLRVTIEVVPFAAGLYRGMAESFTILEFPDPADDYVIFTQDSRGSFRRHDAAEEVAEYREIFEYLRTISLGHEDSMAYLRGVVQDIAQQEPKVSISKTSLLNGGLLQ